MHIHESRTKRCLGSRITRGGRPLLSTVTSSPIRQASQEPLCPAPHPHLVAHAFRMSSTRLSVRRWRKLSFILLLFINIFAILIFCPHLLNNQAPRGWDWRLSERLSLHKLRSDGRLEVNMDGRHPILESMVLGEAKWTRMIRRYVTFPLQLLQLNAL